MLSDEHGRSDWLHCYVLDILEVHHLSSLPHRQAYHKLFISKVVGWHTWEAPSI